MSDTEIVRVDLGARGYDIHIGEGVLAQAGALIGALEPRPARIAILADETAARLHLPRLEESLREAGLEHSALRIPAGETSKCWGALERAVEWLIDERIERDDMVIAFGGGVIGDLAGFAAAVLRRGARFTQIPTTLLAQVDSSVGGKTGINSKQGKNLIGAFHQPELVLADIALLETLPEREFLSGYAEIVKYGLLGDADFFEWLEKNGPALRSGDPAALIEAVRRSCEAKAAIVAEDEQERSGRRALLNLGHTFGHALEAAAKYDGARLLHGEGVAIGMGLAFAVSARMGRCPQEAPSRVMAHFADMGLKRRIGDIPGDPFDAEALIALMHQDKKVQAGRLTFILAEDIGRAYVEENADMDAVRAVLAEALAERRGQI